MKTKKKDIEIDTIGDESSLTASEEKALAEFFKQKKVAKKRVSKKKVS